MADTKVKVRDDGGKGKGIGVGAVASPTSGKKKTDGLIGKLPNAKQKAAVVSVSRSAEIKGKTSASTSTRTVTSITKKKSAAVKIKAQKKVYSLPGQKHDPPEEREPLRIFYESLSKQIPSSEMAQFWMMEHGLLTLEKAKRAYERKQRRQQQLRTGTPIKPSKPQRPESAKKAQILKKHEDIKAGKRVQASDDDDEYIVKLKKAKN